MRSLLLLVFLPTTVCGQTGAESWSVAPPGDFQNPPLQYAGPDPTVEPFLQSVSPADPSASFVSSSGPDHVILNEIPPPAVSPPEWMRQLPDGFSPGIVAREPLSEFKDGFFQRLDFSAAWIDRGSVSGFGISEFDLFSRFALPAPTTEWPLVLQPTFNLRLLDGPASPDLPPRLYETFLDIMWLPRLSPRWVAILSVAPSYYGDGEVDESEAWRLTGRAMARWEWLPGQLQVLFGVLYLNREDITLLPAGGLIWTPSAARRYELIFPRPKFAHRILCGESYEDWIYLGAEFGGNSWAYQAGSVADVVTFRDYRIFFGLERKRDGGAGRRIEIGYVFSRRGRFRSGIADIHAPSTAFLRAGFSF